MTSAAGCVGRATFCRCERQNLPRGWPASPRRHVVPLERRNVTTPTEIVAARHVLPPLVDLARQQHGVVTARPLAGARAWPTLIAQPHSDRLAATTAPRRLPRRPGRVSAGPDHRRDPGVRPRRAAQPLPAAVLWSQLMGPAPRPAHVTFVAAMPEVTPASRSTSRFLDPRTSPAITASRSPHRPARSSIWPHRPPAASSPAPSRRLRCSTSSPSIPSMSRSPATHHRGIAAVRRATPSAPS